LVSGAVRKAESQLQEVIPFVKKILEMVTPMAIKGMVTGFRKMLGETEEQIHTRIGQQKMKSITTSSGVYTTISMTLLGIMKEVGYLLYTAESLKINMNWDIDSPILGI